MGRLIEVMIWVAVFSFFIGGLAYALEEYEYRRRALKAWRTKRAKARTADYQRRARKAQRTKQRA